MNAHKNLLEHYAQTVAVMRHAQRLITPGCARALREEAAKLEREVDELTSLHLLPDLTDLPAPEVR